MLKTISKKASLREIQTELELIRSFMIGLAIEDAEGKYRPEFVKRALRSLKDKPTETFTNAKDFLRKIRKK
ncbi:MAG: hypothetical protein A3C50_03090 [Candidatus Staskawiczbacteria bacterium RIFCSPHIGHO2_02_FULL_43_16]|uniref:Uncharacterized protein n=1 Tax=Candidatus Staskawiczbacteria bacterium RIFCSPHIGHO2_01_FULL_41_41 TaxID=1802203 RepID=A0A1G2HTY0_9BACT|nr:MAG: hypothetical protein A2822_02960 [Candidatus Staskawiczbacteria bacterium RIFCSPHIGHO2_01_FULL_41_41]OGZ68688.1 MAG: hypothetical protein A3C50_03090 [Candidatus Staskawiczbacteria bacterium RIFCSPHIGHO2_02_FULL_43_16]OGZ75151.1 MAG: hypothetical protein A3A12_01020 [Candidatus Staskawiczbacteria bacterium RIFCSPLOWO2_01_FULL_43_17b]